jgi:transaldolase
MHDLSVKVFADGADLPEIRALAANPLIRGFTTNPTLMRKAGIDDYEAFAREVVMETGDRPISFEVFSDEPDEMHRQALKIASWGDHVNVKVPVTNTRGESTARLVRELAESGVRCNVTALMTPEQVEVVTEALRPGPSAFISVFAGRIADTGRDPVPIMRACLDIMESAPALELIWASPRELLNVFQAAQIGCHVITVTPDVLKKLQLVGRDLAEYSLDTVKMFHADAAAAGYQI